MPLTAGDKLGPYEIISLIGKGGMGEVYRAHDPRTGRDVAVKVSAERFSERFDREVRAVASLNHPNICTLFDVGPNYLVMEYIEGEAPKGPMPLETALNYARQIAAALDEAHEKGIVHRDLKPGNIKIKQDGSVKVLDFGLAKQTQQSRDGGAAEDSPTLSMAATQAGMILGTAAYMPPEQAKGKAVDKRADIWAFGVVLYEMLTGKRLFQGEDVTDILASVVKEQPDLSAVPSNVQRLLKSCLEKDPKNRLRDIADAWKLLEESGVGAAFAPSPSQRSLLPWLITTSVAALVAVALSVFAYGHFTEETRVYRVSMVLPEKSVLTAGTTASLPAISPDGRHLAFVTERNARRELWVRDLDSLTARVLPGTQDALDPFWSPDSRFLAFFAEGKLKKIDAAGGPVFTLCEAALGRGGTWSKNGVIVFAPDAYAALFRVSAEGGAATPLTALDPAANENSHRFPWFLPDDRHFLYTARSTDLQHTAIYVADLDSKMRRTVVSGGSNAVYAAPGYLLYMREKTLVAQPFDAGSAKTTGDAVVVAQQVDYIGPNLLFGIVKSGTGERAGV
jgi:hypothetical protein